MIIHLLSSLSFSLSSPPDLVPSLSFSFFFVSSFELIFVAAAAATAAAATLNLFFVLF